MEGRSQHKSQEMGDDRAARPARRSGLRLVESAMRHAGRSRGRASSTASTSRTAGLAALAGLPAGALRTRARGRSRTRPAMRSQHLAAVRTPARIVPQLARGLARGPRGAARLSRRSRPPGAARADADFLLACQGSASSRTRWCAPPASWSTCSRIARARPRARALASPSNALRARRCAGRARRARATRAGRMGRAPTDARAAEQRPDGALLPRDADRVARVFR